MYKAQVCHIEGDLERARDRIEELGDELKKVKCQLRDVEEKNSRMEIQDWHNHTLFDESHKEVERLNHLIRKKDDDLRSLERKLDDERLESSKWKQAKKKAMHY